MLIHNISYRAVSEHVVRNGVLKLPCVGSLSSAEAKISAAHSWGVSMLSLGMGCIAAEVYRQPWQWRGQLKIDVTLPNSGGEGQGQIMPASTLVAEN